MNIRNLSSTSFEEVISCFLSAFEGYFVKLPEDRNYWKSRFEIARVDWNFSFGMFDEDKLIGFIINGIDSHNKSLTAYNTGTGVLPEYRGSGVVDRLYEYALPVLKERGIQKCLLEVICENKRAIKLYERIGFRVTRNLKSYSGVLSEAHSEHQLQKCHFSEVLQKDLYRPHHYSWDNTAEAVKLLEDRVQVWCLHEKNSPEAYVLIDLSGNILQLESRSRNYERLLSSAGLIAKEVKLKNVDSERTNLLDALERLGFTNTVNQYEMEMFI